MNSVGRSISHRRVFFWAISLTVAAIVLLLKEHLPALSLWAGLSPELSPGMCLLLFLTAHVCEYVDSSLGMGYGTTLTPLLLLLGFQPLQVVPCVLLSEMITGVLAAAMHHRDGNINFFSDRKARFGALLLCSLSAFGALLAVSVSVKIPKVWLNGIIAVIIISVGLVIFATLRRSLRFRPVHLMLLGVVAAFNKGLSGGGYGPLTTAGQVVSGFSPKQAVAITSLAESLTCAVGLAAYLVMSRQVDLLLAPPLVLGAVLSVPLSTWSVKHIPEHAMRKVIATATLILGTTLLLKTLW